MAEWEVRVDWNANGDFTDSGDDITDDVQEISWKMGMHKPFQNVGDEAACTLKLRNTDGKYNPENAAGTLYGNLRPRRRVQVNHVSGTVSTTMYMGFIDSLDIEWQSGPAAGQTSATLKCVGLKHYLDKTELSVGLLRDKTADEIIRRILRYAPVVPVVANMWVLGNATYSVLGTTTILQTIDDFADLETGVTTYEYFGDNSNHRTTLRAADGEKEEAAYRMIKEVVEAERGRFFQARDGRATFWNRYHLPLITTAAGTIDSAGTATYKPRAVDYRYGETFVNNIEVVPHQRAEGALQELWSLTGTMDVRPGQKILFNADFTDSYGNEAAAEWAKVGSLEYSGGSVSVGVKPLGKRAEMTVENTDAVQLATVTALTVEGPILTSNNRLMAYADNQTSIQTYGKTPTLRLNLPALEDYETAARIARYEVRRRGIPRGEVFKVMFMNDSSTDEDTHQIAWKIGTRVRVKLDELDHDEEYFIMGEDHRLSDGLKVHHTTYFLELADRNVLWVLGKSRLGVDTVLGI